MEMDNGPLAGLSYEEGETRYAWPEFRNPYEPFFGTGESNWEIHTRAVRAVGHQPRVRSPTSWTTHASWRQSDNG